jgi:sortase A
VRRTIAGFGRTLVTLGLLILLFVAYQLWGTGVLTARAQSDLKQEFVEARERLDDGANTVGPTTSTPPSTVRPTPTTRPLTRPAPPIPPEGEVAGIIRIPKIDVNMAFVEGVSREDLKKGPGHYPNTPMPGTLGNAAIAGHRTTYGAPFHNLDKLEAGDKIIVETLAGKFTYAVKPLDHPDPYQRGKLIVKPTEVRVVDNTPGRAELTLTSCNPKYSAAERIVIKAKLVPNESARVSAPRTKPRPASAGRVKSHEVLLEEGLSGEPKPLAPAVVWGLVASAVGAAWWWAFRRWRHPATWLAGVSPFLVTLFVFYVFLERALPTGSSGY